MAEGKVKKESTEVFSSLFQIQDVNTFSLPPTSAVEVIESVPSICPFVGTLMYIRVCESVMPKGLLSKSTGSYKMCEVHKHWDVFVYIWFHFLRTLKCFLGIEKSPWKKYMPPNTFLFFTE